MERLQGKAALVTGGTTGLGFAVAERFLQEGAWVVITGRDQRLGREAESKLLEQGQVWFVPADASEEEAVTTSVAVAVDRLGGLDVLVNNAGVGVEARTIDTPVHDFDRLMSVNLRGYFLYALAVFPHLVARRGCMIHISSDAGVLGEQSIGVYSVSKSAEIMLSKMLALDGGPHGVRSNCICPGDIAPGMRHMSPPGQEARTHDPSGWPRPPIGRIGEAADVASAAAFLASDEASFCTGVVMLVDGGMRAGVPTRTVP